jgi:hypothetical protein
MGKEKNSIFLLAFLSIVLIVFGTIPVSAHDLECGIWHGEEDALVLGTVEKVDENECDISVKEALPCKKEWNGIYKMLPLDKVSSKMVVNMAGYKSKIYDYSISYHGKTKIEVGDSIIIPVDKSGEKWKAICAPYEVSSLDSETLEFLPEKEKTSMSAAWEAFVHSDGKINEFAFSGKNVVSKITDDNGEKKIEVIFEKKENEDSSNKNESIIQDKDKESAVDAKVLESDSVHVESTNYLLSIPFVIVIIVSVIVIRKYYKFR